MSLDTPPEILKNWFEGGVSRGKPADIERRKIEFSWWEFFFRGGVCRPFRKMVNIFAYTCPNRSGVGAINNPDRSEQVFDAYYISEVSKKFFMDDISMVRP